MQKRPSVLVVDDDEFILSMIQSSLKRVGYPVHLARSAREAFEEISRRVPGIIILDKSMPDMHGDDVLQRVKSHEKTSKVPVVMMTADQTLDGVKKSMALGACDYIVKPITNDTLLMKIHRAVQLLAVT